MTHLEKLDYLIGALLAEDPRYRGMEIPKDVKEKKDLLRALMNVRPPSPLSETFLKIQDEYLKKEAEDRGVVHVDALAEVEPGIKLYQGDITRLDADAIVNAANDQMLGCFIPLHGCIDNAIHSASGIELRLSCDAIMKAQGHPEPTGQAKITDAYNLPSRHVIHTVGPVISGPLTDKDRKLLASCYRESLDLARENHLKSVAFCCISTGEFHFPNGEAAEIAVRTVRDYLKDHSDMEVIFNVFKDQDLNIYKEILGSRS